MLDVLVATVCLVTDKILELEAENIIGFSWVVVIGIVSDNFEGGCGLPGKEGRTT